MLQFITHSTDRYGYVEGAIEALKGGCKWIQLRMKNAHIDDVRKNIEILKPLCHKHEAILIVDDYVELTAKMDIDGVHLGKNDMPVSQARQLLGEKYIIGGTANTWEDVVALVSEGADYIGLGPYKYTDTKQNLSPIVGIDGYRHIIEKCHKNKVSIPIVAIGGIEETDIVPIMDTGVSGIAISGTILRAENPSLTTTNIINTLNYTKHGK